MIYDKERLIRRIALEYMDFDPMNDEPRGRELIALSRELRELSDDDLLSFAEGLENSAVGYDYDFRGGAV